MKLNEIIKHSALEKFDPSVISQKSTLAYKSREKLIEMPINSFLLMALPDRDEVKLQNIRKILNSGELLTSIPFLNINIDQKNAIVDGHEGRHRAIALKELGYITMPVLLRAHNLRWSEQNDPSNKYDYLQQWPFWLISENNNHRIPFPVSRKDSDKNFNE